MEKIHLLKEQLQQERSSRQRLEGIVTALTEKNEKHITETRQNEQVNIY